MLKATLNLSFKLNIFSCFCVAMKPYCVHTYIYHLFGFLVPKLETTMSLSSILRSPLINVSKLFHIVSRDIRNFF